MHILMNPIGRLLAALCMLSFASTVFAFDAGRPNPSASPTRVQVGMFLADIIDMDAVNENFQVELIVAGTWTDPRLAFDPAEAGSDKKIFQGAFQFNEVYSAWWPQFLILNELGSGDMNASKIEVYPDGKVRYLEQRNVTLETPMDLRKFPFDVQTLMELGHLTYHKGTYTDYVGLRGIQRHGKKKWRAFVADVVERLVAALEPDDVVLGGGNAKRLTELPAGCRLGDNANAFVGGFRAWEPKTASQAASPTVADESPSA